MYSKSGFFLLGLLSCFLFTFSSTGWTQFKDNEETTALPGGVTLGESLKQYWECGFTIQARGKACEKIVGTVPVPVNWNEQKVRVVKETVSPYAKISFKKQPGGSQLMMVRLNILPAGEKAEIIVRYEVETAIQNPPKDTSRFRKATFQEIPPNLRQYLKPSIGIECKDKEVLKLASELGMDASNAWKEVEEVYDWVQKEIRYKNGPMKGARKALQDRTGDCEELASVFIAICRAKMIPARVVKVPDHCYAEFYLVDDEGKGHWFPCQVAGDKAFGEMPFQYIILQKGDNFQSQIDRSQYYRYLPTEVKGLGNPSVQEIARKVEE